MKNDHQRLKEQPKLLYIMGGARSGSTILEVLLANNPNVFGAGELTYLIEDGYLANKNCSCGCSCDKCKVWSKVFAQDNLVKIGALAPSTNNKRFDRHKGLFFRFGIGKINVILTEHNQFCWAMIDNLIIQEGVDVVVDSSKYASRAINLYSYRSSDVGVICLTRSAAGMIDSFSKKNKGEQTPKSFLSAALYIFSVNISFLWARRVFGDSCLVISFEQLMEDPVSVLVNMGEWSGISFDNAKNILDAGKAFDIGHIVTGNRLRNAKSIKFNASNISIKRNFNVFERAIIWCLDLLRPR